MTDIVRYKIVRYTSDNILLILVNDYMIGFITLVDNEYSFVKLRNEKNAVVGSDEVLLDSEIW
jgi:hypothetical protein